MEEQGEESGALGFCGAHLEAVSHGGEVINSAGLPVEKEQGSVKRLDKRIAF